MSETHMNQVCEMFEGNSSPYEIANTLNVDIKDVYTCLKEKCGRTES